MTMDHTTLIREVDAWSAADPDETTRAELQRLLAAEDFAELEDRFAGALEFGTAGLRGVLGAGPNRMNRAVVRRTTAGLAALPARHGAGRARGAAWWSARDGRRDEPGVRRGHGARCWLRRGIPALVRDGFTPDAAHRLRGASSSAPSAGVMVTASHNPPEYNGYKVYWGNGAQIIPPHDGGIAEAIAAGRPGARGPAAPLDGRAREGLVARRRARAGAGVPRRACSALRLPPGRRRPDLRIVYTPMHGVGARSRSRRSRRAGFTDVYAGPRAARAGPGVPHRRVPEPRGEGRDGPRRARSPSARRPISSSRTTPTPTGSRCSPGRRPASCGRSPATRSACCSGTTCSRRAEGASGRWS